MTEDLYRSRSLGVQFAYEAMKVIAEDCGHITAVIYLFEVSYGHR